MSVERVRTVSAGPADYVWSGPVRAGLAGLAAAGWLPRNREPTDAPITRGSQLSTAAGRRRDRARRGRPSSAGSRLGCPGPTAPPAGRDQCSRSGCPSTVRTRPAPRCFPCGTAIHGAGVGDHLDAGPRLVSRMRAAGKQVEHAERAEGVGHRVAGPPALEVPGSHRPSLPHPARRSAPARPGRSAPARPGRSAAALRLGEQIGAPRVSLSARPAGRLSPWASRPCGPIQRSTSPSRSSGGRLRPATTGCR